MGKKVLSRRERERKLSKWVRVVWVSQPKSRACPGFGGCNRPLFCLSIGPTVTKGERLQRTSRDKSIGNSNVDSDFGRGRGRGGGGLEEEDDEEEDDEEKGSGREVGHQGTGWQMWFGKGKW
ncbi:hypothetical protein LX36DRAFT_112263 [Colletotrichum falcatum]|nr:hypothetical protein LX36DRAFT_112263 [Colletotrichum falcatum]